MFANLFLAAASAGAALALLTQGATGHAAAWALGLLSLWQGYCAFTRKPDPRYPVILRLGGFSWDVFSFCRGWLITGQVGTGKTAAAINTMLWQVSKNCPTWGGVCIDDKGLYWETLSSMLGKLGRASDLILLQVRPENCGPNWQPIHRFNFLDNPHLPYSAKAKIICDVAAALGQRSDQSFFRVQAQVQIEFAFKALHCAGFGVTLASAHQFFASDALILDVMARVEKQATPEAELLADHYLGNWLAQPAEQLGGVKTTIANYLNYFTDPDIAEVFCPEKSTFDFGAVDQGKIICMSIPQRFQVERRYLNTLLKLTYYTHALRRFDKPAAARAADNLLIFWADEAQKTVTASNDGMSDYNVVDVIREARATVVAATQSYASLIPPMGDERKAKVFIANMANRVTFCAADEDSAKIAADTLGKRKTKRRTEGYAGGKRTSSFTEEDKYVIEPHALRKLRKFEAVVQHCDLGFRKLTIPPLGADGKIPTWYRERN
ncbi:MAG TPA: type IV secretion system DNA-binding domain-containing protein [Opitutaceae bacterium]|nr:type IV secretion system DNA-binding domain-containing protein [Opitutaceae bacterium]